MEGLSAFPDKGEVETRFGDMASIDTGAKGRSHPFVVGDNSSSENFDAKF
jgi:hypothetical protein